MKTSQSHENPSYLNFSLCISTLLCLNFAVGVVIRFFSGISFIPEAFDSYIRLGAKHLQGDRFTLDSEIVFLFISFRLLLFTRINMNIIAYWFRRLFHNLAWQLLLWCGTEWHNESKSHVVELEIYKYLQLLI